VPTVPEAAWKRHEREVARLLGGERLPVTGKRGADALAGPWCIEVKTRRSLPEWLLKSINQAEEGAKATGRLPLVVLVYTLGQGRKARRYPLMPLEVLASWRDDGARKCAEKMQEGCRKMQGNAD
jgi:hypothetical protein